VTSAADPYWYLDPDFIVNEDPVQANKVNMELDPDPGSFMTNI